MFLMLFNSASYMNISVPPSYPHLLPSKFILFWYYRHMRSKSYIIAACEKGVPNVILFSRDSAAFENASLYPHAQKIRDRYRNGGLSPSRAACGDCRLQSSKDQGGRARCKCSGQAPAAHRAEHDGLLRRGR